MFCESQTLKTKSFCFGVSAFAFCVKAYSLVIYLRRYYRDDRFSIRAIITVSKPWLKLYPRENYKIWVSELLKQLFHTSYRTNTKSHKTFSSAQQIVVLSTTLRTYFLRTATLPNTRSATPRIWSRACYSRGWRVG